MARTKGLFDAPDVGTKDINGTPVKQPSVMYARHLSQLMLNFAPIGKLMQNQEQNGFIHLCTSKTNQQSELLVVIKELTQRMTSWP
jgi:hypothetical protein